MAEDGGGEEDEGRKEDENVASAGLSSSSSSGRDCFWTMEKAKGRLCNPPSLPWDGGEERQRRPPDRAGWRNRPANVFLPGKGESKRPSTSSPPTPGYGGGERGRPTDKIRSFPPLLNFSLLSSCLSLTFFSGPIRIGRGIELKRRPPRLIFNGEVLLRRPSLFLLLLLLRFPFFRAATAVSNPVGGERGIGEASPWFLSFRPPFYSLPWPGPSLLWVFFEVHGAIRVTATFLEVGLPLTLTMCALSTSYHGFDFFFPSSAFSACRHRPSQVAIAIVLCPCMVLEYSAAAAVHQSATPITP